MAHIHTEGLCDLLNDLKNSADDFDECTHEMIDAGSDVAVEEWKKGIESTLHAVKNADGTRSTKVGYIDTGAMLASVGKTIKKSTVAEIYPQGKDGKERNATKAYVLHYGRSNMRGTRFVDGINDRTEAKSFVVMRDVIDEYLKKHNL